MSFIVPIPDSSTMHVFFLIAFLQFFTSPLANTSPQRPYRHGIETPCDDIPAFNSQIVAYVKSKLNKKVGRGECWDLAAETLNTLNAQWNGRYEYGRLLDEKTECVYPGDFIQFENVIVETQEGNTYLRESMSHHTAMVYEVQAPGIYVIAHQNYGKNSRKVNLTTLRTPNITRGTIQIYRPIPKA